MSHYDSSVPKIIAEDARALKFRRRILSARNLETPPKVKAFKVFGRFATVAAVSFMVLSADWGDGEHCFSGARRWYDQKKMEMFALSKEDEEELRATGKWPIPTHSNTQRPSIGNAEAGPDGSKGPIFPGKS